MKKTISIILALLVLLLFPTTTALATTLSEENIDQLIVEEVIKDMPIGSVYSIVSLEPTDDLLTNTIFTTRELSQAKAIRITTPITADAYEETLIVPYAEQDDGVLVNSFVYANYLNNQNQLLRASGSDVISVTDLTITVSGFFQREDVTISGYLTRAYIMQYGSMSWAKTNPSSLATVKRFQLYAGVTADRYTYPGGQLVQANWSTSTPTQDVTSPTQNVPYSTTYAMNGTSYVAVCSSAIDHAGYVWWRFAYQTNSGSPGEQQQTLTVFAK